MRIIAVDAGGTKARFALYDVNGIELKRLEHPSLHPLQVGYDQMASALRVGVDAVRDDQVVDFISFGLAGYGQNQEIRSSIEKAIHKKFPFERYCIQSDVDCALMSALKGQDGLMLIAGTGSIALASYQGQRHRVGGWGHWIGDEGSAFWIGKQVLSLFSKMADGRLKKTALFDCVMDSLVLDEPSDMIKILSEHKRPKEAIAALARVCYLAASKKDKHALHCFKMAAKELALHIQTSLNLNPHLQRVRLAGGVFEAKEFVFDPLCAYLDPQLDIALSEDSPLFGAYLIGKQKEAAQV